MRYREYSKKAESQKVRWRAPRLQRVGCNTQHPTVDCLAASGIGEAKFATPLAAISLALHPGHCNANRTNVQRVALRSTPARSSVSSPCRGLGCFSIRRRCDATAVSIAAVIDGSAARTRWTSSQALVRAVLVGNAIERDQTRTRVKPAASRLLCHQLREQVGRISVRLRGQVAMQLHDALPEPAIIGRRSRWFPQCASNCRRQLRWTAARFQEPGPDSATRMRCSLPPLRDNMELPHAGREG
jgi:hypothetical protein